MDSSSPTAEGELEPEEEEVEEEAPEPEPVLLEPVEVEEEDAEEPEEEVEEVEALERELSAAAASILLRRAFSQNPTLLPVGSLEECQRCWSVFNIPYFAVSTQYEMSTQYESI